ncbi:unnamed protein product [Spirodela intermedia]|uniref:non-specific serine/threonine protein kinase n=1 Tax=Spirodela intermedia TaxID=51605 RepID=A0A7I8IK55_SPIIN|nr:unnamed protein product [Spirodela intermedia]CAA6657357.1 unnamed protein product [Spirodela intermedia]
MDFSLREPPSSSSRVGKPRSKASDLYSTVIVHGEDSETGGRGGRRTRMTFPSSHLSSSASPRGSGSPGRSSSSPIVRPLRLCQEAPEVPFADARRASPATSSTRRTPPSCANRRHIRARRARERTGILERLSGGLTVVAGGGRVRDFPFHESGGGNYETGGGKPPSSAPPTTIQQQRNRMSVSSVPDSITKEDPTAKYDLLHELGKGSYGAVYKARDIKTSELVAIKVISLSEGEEGYEEIRGEIEMLQQCSHPNVVRYFGSYQGEEYLWIVMEYCGGGSVADLMNITEEPLDEGQKHTFVNILKESKGLSYLHSIFKVHRDIKGGNILLTDSRRGDFGVAAQLTRTMSKRNTLIGTPHWMAQKLFRRVDVWALGVSAIEMAEGFPPRSNVHPMRVLFMISSEPAPMLEDKEKWSLLFHDFVAKCLTKDPRLRPTAVEMLKHKFIEKCNSGASKMLPKIKRARQIRATIAVQVVIKFESCSVHTHYTVDKGSTSTKHQRFQGVELPSEGDFGTVIVRSHTNDNEVGPETSSVNNAEGLLPASVDAKNDAVSNSGDKITSLRKATQRPQGVDQTLDFQEPKGLQSTAPGSPVSKLNAEGAHQSREDGNNSVSRGGPVVGSTVKVAVSRKAFAVQDKLWSIYAAGNTVPIPFLRAIDVSPLALVSDNVLGDRSPGEAAVLHLKPSGSCSMVTGKQRKPAKPRTRSTGGTYRFHFITIQAIPLPASVQQRLAASSTLMNLAQALAYHQTCYEDMPLQDLQAAQERQTIQNLCDTLRTILRL